MRVKSPHDTVQSSASHACLVVIIGLHHGATDCPCTEAMAECSYRRAQLREKLECSFPIDDLLSKMYAANVLTFYEFEEIKSTPNFVKRNSTFFDYLGRKEAMAIHLTLGILSKSEYVTYHYLGEILRELFGVRGTEYEGGAPNASQPMRGASTIVESSKVRTPIS